MLYFISILMIVFEVSLPFSANIYVITLPFLTYLVSLKKEKEVILIILVAILHSLQTTIFFEITFILLVSYYIFSQIFMHLTYGKTNILLISLLQGGIYVVLSMGNLKKEYIVGNIIGFIILNYIYMRISKKKESIKG